MNLKKVVCGLFVLVGLLMVMSCTVGQEEGTGTGTDPDLYIPPVIDGPEAVDPAVGIEYWEHTITVSESAYQGNSLYFLDIEDERFELGAWYDFWWKYSADYWIRLEQYYDSDTDNLYFMSTVGDGVVLFSADYYMVGDKLIIFNAPATAMSSAEGTSVEDFNAQDYFEEWPPPLPDSE